MFLNCDGPASHPVCCAPPLEAHAAWDRLLDAIDDEWLDVVSCLPKVHFELLGLGCVEEQVSRAT